ncbi:MAG: hypothetical protein FJ363_03245 [Gemmatimonadetes bacterium]|nr:hypothetical protein [Gemmatimonadota bacterium]
MPRFVERMLAAGTVLLVALSFLPADAHAIPAFARKYRVSCSMCHAPAPRLNTFGENFAGNGFEMAVGEPARDTVDTGDPLLRLPNSLPLAVRFEAYQRFLTDRRAGDAAVDQQTPWIVKVLSGGQVADKISYYMYFLLTERGEVAGLEDAYVQFTDIKGSGVSLIVGQFQVSDPAFKRELRLHYDDYQPYRVKVGRVASDLTYDRGLMALWSPRAGTDITAEVVTGDGLNHANSARQYDTDNNKNFALRISQDIGRLRVGVFGYTGKQGAGAASSTMRVFGPDATVPLGSMGELNVQALRRWDSNPFLGSCTVANPCLGNRTAPFSTTVDAAMAEVILWPQGPAGQWFVTGLLNYVDASAPVVSLRIGERGDDPSTVSQYTTGTFGLHYLLKRNVRLMGETTWDFERDRARLIAGINLAF